MDNNINSIEIYAILAQRYRQDIKITELHGGRDKDVYVAELSGMRKFAVLVNKKNTIMRKYRTVKSNYFQKYLYKKGIKVPDVLDLFEIERGPILACHTYIEGKQITKLNKKDCISMRKNCSPNASSSDIGRQLLSALFF